MRISDWSSDVCSSDLFPVQQFFQAGQPGDRRRQFWGRWFACPLHKCQLEVLRGLVQQLLQDKFADGAQADDGHTTFHRPSDRAGTGTTNAWRDAGSVAETMLAASSKAPALPKATQWVPKVS